MGTRWVKLKMACYNGFITKAFAKRSVFSASLPVPKLEAAKQPLYNPIRTVTAKLVREAPVSFGVFRLP